jgi:hypothetical protein
VAGLRIFVCYAQESPEDSRFAQRLIDDLRENGIDVATLEGRQSAVMEGDVIHALNKKLQGSQWVILVQTPTALSSPYIQLTINTALNLVLQRRMRGVLSLMAEPCSAQDIPPTWTSFKTFDASEDYPKAFARLLLMLDTTLSTVVPSVKMRAAPSLALPPMMTTSAPSAMEDDDQPLPLKVPLWLRQKQSKQWLVPLVGTLTLVLILGISMPVLAKMLMLPTVKAAHTHIAPSPTSKLQSMPTIVATQSSIAPIPTPKIASMPTIVATHPIVVPTPTIAMTAQKLYTKIMLQQPVLNDPLSNQDGNGWDTPADGSPGCEFANNAYGVTAQATTVQPVRAYCLARDTNFSNFAYQVQMAYTISEPSPCGLVFRANPSGSYMDSYRLYFSTDGSYELDGYQGIQLKQSTGTAPINPNPGTNTIAVIAINSDIYIYANGQFVVHVADNAATVGAIGVVCRADTNAVPAEAVFTVAKVWQL